MDRTWKSKLEKIFNLIHEHSSKIMKDRDIERAQDLEMQQRQATSTMEELEVPPPQKQLSLETEQLFLQVRACVDDSPSFKKLDDTYKNFVSSFASLLSDNNLPEELLTKLLEDENFLLDLVNKTPWVSNLFSNDSPSNRKTFFHPRTLSNRLFL